VVFALYFHHKGAFFAEEPQKTGLSAPIPQTLPQVKSVTHGNACGISNKQIHFVDLRQIPCVEEAPTFAAAPSACRI
jgi:hypothetical protein